MSEDSEVPQEVASPAKKRTSKRNAVPKGQPAITSFVNVSPAGGGKRKRDSEEEAEEQEQEGASTSEPETSEVPQEEEEETPKKKGTRGKKAQTGDKEKKPRKPRQPRKKKEDKPKKPKRGKSAYIIFSQEKRPEVKAANPAMAFGAIAKRLGEMWKALDANQRKPYEQKAEEDKQRAAAENAENGLTTPEKKKESS